MAAGDCPPPTDFTTRRRRLTAILHADAVGYSRLSGTDEEGTHTRLMAYRSVIGDFVSRHNGRVVGTAGDAVLAEFESVLEALACAVEIQDELGALNAALPTAQRLPFRIGVNIGDVIVDGDDIFGEGVNVAARVEALADPGGVAVSGAVYEQTRNRLNLSFQDRGRHRVKNIEEPLRVFAIAAAGAPKLARAPRRNILVAAVAIAAALALGASVWLWRSSANQPITPTAASAAPTTQEDRPTIAILPFLDNVGDVEHGYFVDGITEDVIGDLGRFSNLLVLSWNAVAKYKGRTMAPQDLRRELTVRYLVSGTVRRAGNRLRVAVQLTDAESGVLLWSGRYDETLENVFAVQDRITRQVVGTLAVRLTHLEQDRAFEKPTENLDAYDHVLRARDLLRRVERAANVEARASFEKAIALDPMYVDAHVGLGWTHMNDFLWGWTEWPQRAIERANELAGKALDLDKDSATAHALRAQVLTFKGAYEQADREISRAINLNPNNAMSQAIRGALMSWWGNPEASVESLQLALRLDPNPAGWWLMSLAQSYYFLGRYEETIGFLDRDDERFAEDPTPHALLAAAYAELGRHEDAARAVDKLRRLSPFFNAEAYAAHFANPEHGRLLLEGLRKAGLN
jgi:adenylate cyclase